MAAHEQAVEAAADRSEEELTGHGRSDTELFEMIVAADAAHEREERSGFNEDRKTVANDHERRSNSKPGQRQHEHGDGQSGEQARQQAGRKRLESAHGGQSYNWVCPCESNYVGVLDQAVGRD